MKKIARKIITKDRKKRRSTLVKKLNKNGQGWTLIGIVKSVQLFCVQFLGQLYFT